MKFIRWFLGRLVLFFDWLFSPKEPDLSDEARRQIAASSSGLYLYQFEACPFCVKVRRYLKREGISLPIVDATRDPGRSELAKGGGKIQTPCLKIEKAGADTVWLYESNDIIAYLRANVVGGGPNS